MKNLGPVSTRWLAEAGIHTLDDLRASGAVAAYLRVAEKQPQGKVSLNLLWGMQAALNDCHWQAITPNTKAQLLQELDAARDQRQHFNHTVCNPCVALTDSFRSLRCYAAKRP